MNATDKQLRMLVDNLLAEGKEYAYIAGYLESLLIHVIEGSTKKHKAQVKDDLDWHITAHTPAEIV